MQRLILQHQSLCETYSSLLIRARAIDIDHKNGTAICVHCGEVRSSHLPDERCSTYSMSGRFKDRAEDDRNKISRALELIEELQSL